MIETLAGKNFTWQEEQAAARNESTKVRTERLIFQDLTGEYLMTAGIKDYYQKEYNTYHQETFSVDPSLFLSPLTTSLPAPAHILDIGCGSGRDLCWLCERGYQCTGFERSKGLAELALRNSGCQIIEADFTVYDFSLIRVDAVILVGALVHFRHDELKEVLSNCLQALHEKGLVLLTLKEGKGSMEDGKGRLFYLWQDEDVKIIFNGLGLKLVDFTRTRSQIRHNDVWLGYLLKLE